VDLWKTTQGGAEFDIKDQSLEGGKDKNEKG